MSDIRVTYSGLVSLATGFGSVATGIIFTLIVTRTLSPEEFGTWGLIGGLVSYVLIIHPMVLYWVTREVARGEESGKTALHTTSIFTAVAILAYIIIAFYVGNQTDADTEVLIYGVILIPALFFNRVLTSINMGYKPQAIGYSLIVFEILKIPGAIALVYFLEMGVLGAIIASLFAYFGGILVLAIYAREKIKEKIQKKFLKKWLKLFWLPGYDSLIPFLTNLDVLIYTLITGSVVGIAFWSVANAISNVVSHGGRMSVGIYPKILEGGREKGEYISENLNWLFFFSIPLIALSMTFARPGLFILNPEYELAYPIVIFLSVRIFLQSVLRLFASGLYGVDQVDMNESSTWKDYVKSTLFTVSTIRIIQNVIYIVPLAIILYLLATDTAELDLVIYWSVIMLLVQIPFTIGFYFWAKKYFRLKIDVFSILKYTLRFCLFLI